MLMQKKNDGSSKISPPCKKHNLKKSPKRNQNPSSHYNIVTNLKFQHNPKYHLSKNTQMKIDLLLLPRGQNPLS
jgi:hypothetical protein